MNPTRDRATRMLTGVVAVAAVFVAGGCGGSESTEPGTSVSALGLPEPNEPFERAAESAADALRSGDCDEIADLVPVNRDVKAEQYCEAIGTQVKGARAPRFERFDGGGVIEFERKGKPVVVVLVLDEDGDYHLSHVDPYLGRPIAGTEAPPELDDAAEAAVDALATRDCDKFLEVAHLRLSAGAAFKDRKDACRYAEQNPVAAVVEADPEAQPVRLGANSAYGLYGIGTEGVHYTVIIGRQPPTPPPGTNGPQADEPAEFAFVDAIQTNSERAAGAE